MLYVVDSGSDAGPGAGRSGRAQPGRSHRSRHAGRDERQRLCSPFHDHCGMAQAVGHIVGGAVIARHRRRGGPREVVVQHLPERLVGGQPDVLQRLVEAGDRSPVHLVVRAVAAVHPHDRRLVAIAVGVAGGPTERLGPVRSEPLGVLRVKSVAERVADHRRRPAPASARPRPAGAGPGHRPRPRTRCPPDQDDRVVGYWTAAGRPAPAQLSSRASQPTAPIAV